MRSTADFCFLRRMLIVRLMPADFCHASPYILDLLICRLSPDSPHEQIAGLPGLDIFGAHMRAAHAIAIAAATAMLGWRGLLLGAGVWAWWKISQEAVRTAGGRGATPGSAAQAQRYFSEYLGQQQGGSGTATGRPRGTAQPRPSDPWSGRGKGQKVGSK